MNCVAKESAFGLVDFIDSLLVNFIDLFCNFFIIYFLLPLDLIGSPFSSFLKRKHRLLFFSFFFSNMVRNKGRERMRSIFNEDPDDKKTQKLCQLLNSAFLPNPLNSLIFAAYKLF